MGVPVSKNHKHSSIRSFDKQNSSAEKNVMNNMIKKAYIKLENNIISSSYQNHNDKYIKRKPDELISYSKRALNGCKSKELKNNTDRSETIPSDEFNRGLISMNELERKRKEFENNNLKIKNNDSKKIKIKFGTKFDFQEKLFSLSEDVLFLILTFLMEDYFSLLLINSLWYYKFNEILDNKFLKIDNLFIKEHIDILSLKQGYNSTKRFGKNKNNFRMDRNLIAEVLPNAFENKSIIIRYTYKLINSKTNEEFCTEFAFDLIEKKNKQVWIYQEDFNYNFDEIKEAFVQSIMPIRKGDNIKLSIIIFNMKGLIDIDSIQWKSPIIEEIPIIPKILTCENIKLVNQDRICELESLLDNWIPYEYFNHPNKILLDFFEPQLFLKEVKCCGVGLLATKMYFLAKEKGIVKSGLKLMGINIEILEDGQETTSELKRKGLAFDLENKLELNIGDILIFYLSKGN